MRNIARNIAIAGILMPLLWGCGSDAQRQSHAVAGEVGSAAQQPLEDFNLRYKRVPLPLVAALNAPYAMPASCEAINLEVRDLSIILGPDFDAPRTGKSTSERLHEQADALAHDAASSWIPFRGVVRDITGAQQRSDDMAAAILAGSVRRGFLKGIKSQRGC